MGRVLTFDIETHERKKMYSMKPEEFVRLIGYAWDDGDVVITTNLEELKDQIKHARWIIGHNIHDFDLRAVYGTKSDTPMQLADEGRVYDTWTHAALVHPAPSSYINRKGREVKTFGKGQRNSEAILTWFGLDEQAYQLGVPGKTHELKDLAYEFGDPSIKTKKERTLDGFGKIPVDDPRYVEYLIGDVKASRAVAKALMARGALNEYALREQRIESRKACISSNGFRVDQERAEARVNELQVKREDIMYMLEEKYDFPIEGKQPWRTNEGKEAIKKALADVGITEGSRPTWPRTQTGSLSLGGEVLLDLTRGTDAEDLGEALATLMGQRSLAQLALDSCYPDGFAHPQITMLQRSGRWSTTNPGLTVWSARGDKAIEKWYFVADDKDQVLIEIDLSNADARAVAALSGDTRYAERFEPGADGHLINAWAAWGKDVVGTDKKNPITAQYRQRAKVPGHGWGYKIGAKKLSLQTGMPVDEAKEFLTNMNKAFPDVVAWQRRCTDFALKNGYVINPWGRKMWVEPGREFTQAPALQGQSATREIVCDALLAMPHRAVRRCKAQIHDALVFSVPRANWQEWRDYFLNKIQSTMNPEGGQKIEFPAGCGPAADDWFAASHD
jgi:DNA polymerase-1